MEVSKLCSDLLTPLVHPRVSEDMLGASGQDILIGEAGEILLFCYNRSMSRGNGMVSAADDGFQENSRFSLEASAEAILYGATRRAGQTPEPMPELPTAPRRASIQDLSEIPTQVIDVFNELLLEQYRGDVTSTIIQLDELTKRLKPLGIETEQALDWGWLDIDRLYAHRGWHVEYGVFEADEGYLVGWQFSDPKHR